ncbi:MAG: sulfur carrier protein ThiS [Rhodospirillales bacterium]|jgi:molybdopterin synthase sulfur carrier subunit
MKVRIKLYAMLGDYLPSHAKKNEADVKFAEGTSISAMLSSLGVPLEQCHLVLVNGVFVPPSERDSQSVVDGDALAVWPPVAGG